MIIQKCKICGGDLEAVVKHIAQCPYCGSMVTLPHIDDGIRADLFRRGNFFRMKYEFDRAASAYEHIIAQDPNDAEAHFCLMLCHFGVAYVKDPRTETYFPTIHKASSSSVFDNIDYRKAIECAEPDAAAIYQHEASRIQSILEELLRISRLEQPYDVFLCYKESTLPAVDPNARSAAQTHRTRDSVLAQDIYEALTAKGLRVFFSRITLGSKLGSEYESCIFSALQSAKVMLVIGTSAEHLQSPWVRNEWLRYLDMMKHDRSRTLVPVIQGMDEYDLPDELSGEIPRSMDEPGAMQDLIRGVLKLVGHRNKTVSASKIQELAAYIRQLLEDRNYIVIPALAQEILDEDPENAWAYLFLLLAKYRVSTLEELKESPDDSVPDSELFGKLCRFAKGPLLEQAEDYALFCRQRKAYDQGMAHFRQKEYQAAHVCFTDAGSYADAAKYARRCKLQLDKAAYQAEYSQLNKTLDQRMSRNHSDTLALGQKLHDDVVRLSCDKPRWKCTVLSVVLVAMLLYLLPEWIASSAKQLSLMQRLDDDSIVPYALLAMFYFYGRSNDYLKRKWDMGGLSRLLLQLFVGYIPVLTVSYMLPLYSVPLALLVMGINMAASLLWYLRGSRNHKAYIAAAVAERWFLKEELPRIKHQELQAALEELNQRYLPLIGEKNLKHLG